MIALIILGLGLLFIAAALPVGLEYTRQTVELSIAEAATDYALEQLELNLRTSQHLYDWDLAPPNPAGVIHRLDNIFRPRGQDPQPPPRFPLATGYEPVFKVRPLVMGNIRFEPATGSDTREIVDDVESTITAYLTAAGFSFQPPHLEIDYYPAVPDLALARHPFLPGLARIYPPIEPVTTFTVGKFFRDPHGHRDYPRYMPRYSALDDEQLDREREKCLDRRVAWTVFCRRVAHDEPGPDGSFGTADDVVTNPLLYELIIVVTRRTSVNHRYPRQNVSAANMQDFEQAQAHVPSSPPLDDRMVGTDRLAPTPWLVVFDSGAPGALPLLNQGTAQFDEGDPDRTLFAAFSDPATLTFRCTPEVGALLPVGSIFIPALNDHFRQVPPGSGMFVRQFGFVPHAPHTVPIYEVVERPDSQAVIVKNNGYYPWNVTGDPQQTGTFPVWVIPPAFAERDSSGQPVYERRSPILSVVRRVVTLHEIAP